MTHEQLERRVVFLSRYAVGVTLILVVLVLSAGGPPWWPGAPSSWWRDGQGPAQPARPAADTIRAAVLVAEQVRVVEPDGSLAFLAANSERVPGVVIDGDTVTTRGGSAGLLFFVEGHEVGGLTYRIDKDRDPPYALGHFALDQYHQDQVVFMQYDGSGARQRAGVYVNDNPTDYSFYDYKAFMDSTAALPEAEREAARARLQERVERGELGGRRVALESDRRVASLRLSDYRGRERLRAVVDSVGAARIEFLDTEGDVVRAITAEE